MSREIKGPEDCEPLELFDVEHHGGMSVCGELVKVKGFTAQEVGQIIALAMDAASPHNAEFMHPSLAPDILERVEKDRLAWRFLSKKLKGGI